MGRGASSALDAAPDAGAQTRGARRPTAEQQLERNYERFKAQHINRKTLTSTAEVEDLVARIKARGIKSISLDFETEKGLSDEWDVKNGAIRLIQIGIRGEQTGERRQWIIDCQRADASAIKDRLGSMAIEKQVFYSPFELRWAKAAFNRSIQNVWDPVPGLAVDPEGTLKAAGERRARGGRRDPARLARQGARQAV